MQEPNWQNCSEEELWYYVGWHLESAGISSTLVGGAVVAIYTEGLYRSGDLDLISETLNRQKLVSILQGIGFNETKSRYFKHPECHHLFLEFPPGPVEIGREYPIEPAEVEVMGQKLKLLSPTDSVKDRLASYVYWQSRANFDQAVLICLRQEERIQYDKVEAWCQSEGHASVYQELVEAITREKNIE